MKSLLLYVAFVMCLVNWECGNREVKEEKFVIEGQVENCNTFMKVAVVARDGRVAFSQGNG